MQQNAAELQEERVGGKAVGAMVEVALEEAKVGEERVEGMAGEVRAEVDLAEAAAAVVRAQ